jgi:hypothetical protein
MRVVTSIVEGYGDKEAVPHLVARMAAHFEIPTISPNPIRVGEWRKVRRAGELERHLSLAHSRQADHILVILDLDDFCPVTEMEQTLPRIEAWKNGRLCSCLDQCFNLNLR